MRLADRRAALERGICPDHGCPLEEQEDVDELGPWVSFRCVTGDHVFGSVHDSFAGYVPVELDRDEEPPLDQVKRQAGDAELPGMPS